MPLLSHQRSTRNLCVNQVLRKLRHHKYDKHILIDNENQETAVIEYSVATSDSLEDSFVSASVEIMSTIVVHFYLHFFSSLNMLTLIKLFNLQTLCISKIEKQSQEMTVKMSILAMTCERTGTSNKDAALLVNTAFQDLKIITKEDK